MFYSVLGGRSVSSGSTGIVHLLRVFCEFNKVIVSFCISHIVMCEKLRKRIS